LKALRSKTQTFHLTELDEEEMMACSFTRIRSPMAGLRQAAARDPDKAVARRYRLREARPE